MPNSHNVHLLRVNFPLVVVVNGGLSLIRRRMATTQTIALLGIRHQILDNAIAQLASHEVAIVPLAEVDTSL